MKNAPYDFTQTSVQIMVRGIRAGWRRRKAAHLRTQRRQGNRAEVRRLRRLPVWHFTTDPKET